MEGILWKEASERDGNLVILFPESPGTVRIVDAETGEVLATGTSSGPSNNFGDTIRFDRPGSAFTNVRIELENGENFYIDDGSIRRENILTSPANTKAEAPTGTAAESKGGAEGAEGSDGRVPGVPGIAPPIFIDPNLVQPFPIPLTQIPQANFNFTDPLESAAATGEFNREQSAQNFATGLSRAQQIQQEELASIIQFAEGMSQFQQQLVGQENQFNQQQRIDAANAAIPGIQDIFADRIERGQTLAEGRLLKTSEDEAFELAARNASAEGNVARGLGDDSIVGRSVSDQLSAQQRLGLTQLGEGFLQNSIQQAAGILMDVPLKASISQRLPSQPNVPFAQVASQQQATENALTTLSPQAALSSTVQQEQFQTNLEQNTNQFNANLQFNTDKFNSSQFYSAMLEQLGLTVFNAQQQQAFIQNVFNAQAQGEQLEESRARYDDLLSDYRKNRDRQQFIEGVAALVGASGKLPKEVWDNLSDLGSWAVNGVAEFLGVDPPFPGEDSGSSSTSTGSSASSSDKETPDVDSGTATEPPREPESAGTEETSPEPFPEESESSTSTSTPGEGVDDIGDAPERMLVYNPRTGKLRYRFFTDEQIERLNYNPDLKNFKSGADLQLTRRQLRELRGLV